MIQRKSQRQHPTWRRIHLNGVEYETAKAEIKLHVLILLLSEVAHRAARVM